MLRSLDMSKSDLSLSALKPIGFTKSGDFSPVFSLVAPPVPTPAAGSRRRGRRGLLSGRLRKGGYVRFREAGVIKRMA